jgi:predicted AAA+ superfamily ATPase
VGKTTLLKQLREEVKDKKTFYLNVEVEEDKEILNQSPENIFNLSQIDKTEQQIIFIDEIQLLNNPSNFLKHLYDLYNENLKLVVS